MWDKILKLKILLKLIPINAQTGSTVSALLIGATGIPANAGQIVESVVNGLAESGKYKNVHSLLTDPDLADEFGILGELVKEYTSDNQIKHDRDICPHCNLPL